MILRVEQLVVRRGARTVVGGFDLAIAAGEVVGLVGKNGSGKSTLLMAIAGVLAPTEGRVLIGGAPGGATTGATGATGAAASVWGGARERLRARTRLGYVPEAADPPGFLLGGELWALVAATRGTEAPAPALIEALGLDELRELAIERMSLGQRRRACLGAALLGPPDLLVLDEPDNGLDARRLDALANLVTAHAAAGRAALIATHDPALLERTKARVVSIGDAGNTSE